MAAITDGTFTSPLQDGDKQVSFPFDYLGDAYARIITRPYVMLSSSYSAPRTLTTTSVTNYILRSESFDNASWTKTEATVTANAIANPNDGATTADSFVETVVNAGHGVTQLYTATATATTASIFAKSNGRDWLYMAFVDSAAAGYLAFFNLSSGVVGTTSGATSTITSLGNGWYRCTFTFTPASGVGTLYNWSSTNGSTTVYAGDTTKGLYLWGAQLERASSAGTYLPTTSATRTSSLRTRDAVDNTTDSAADQFAFLCQETPPDEGSLRQGIVRLSRSYCRVPAQQTDYSTAIVSRPVMHDITSGGYYAVSFDDGVTSHVFSSRLSVSSVAAMSSDTETVDTALPPYPCTLLSAAATSATFNANTAVATIQTQLNAALPSCGTFTVTNPAFNKLNIAWTNAGTMSVVTTCSNVTTSVTSTTALFTSVGTSTFPATVFVKTGSAHGAAAGDRAAVWNGARLAGYGIILSVPDTTTFVLRAADVTDGDAFITHAAVSPSATARYVNGPVNVSTKIVTSTYYPGWSPDITTPQDIPVVQTQIDAVSWLGLIVASTAYGCIISSELEKWNGGPFYQQSATYCQMSDALETISVTA